MTMTYEQKFKIGDIVKGKRTFNGEVIEGKFNGFRLYNKLNPKSVVGVIDTNERCYDVSVDSIESLESEDEKIRKVVKEYINQHYPVDSPVMYKSKILNWLENQKPIKLNEEDEKIRQALLQCCDDWGKGQSGIMNLEDVQRIRAWLEKQKEQPEKYSLEQAVEIFLDALSETPYNNKPITDAQVVTKELLKFLEDANNYNPDALIEQKPVDKVEPKFHEGEWVVTDSSNIVQIKAIESSKYVLENTMRFSVDYVDKCWQKWTIQDAKDGDVLEFGDHGRLVVGIVSYVNKTTGKVDVNCLLENNNFKVGIYYNLDTIKPHPATKEQRDLLFQKMREVGYEWDAEKKELKKKELKKIESNPAWSEEDEKIYFAKWQAIPSCKNLYDAIKEGEGKKSFHDDFEKASYAQGMIDGSMWQKQQMMRDAVEGTIKYEIGSTEIPQCDRRYQVLSDQVHIPNAKLGDKVKIIIVKEKQQ